MTFVDITNDIAFRKIFGNESKKKSLISFLNAVINLPEEEQIIDVTITNPFQLGILNDGKSTIIDVKAQDEKGNIFIVEMQVAEYNFFHKRLLYYTSHSYVTQISKGADYKLLKPVYFIGILEFEIGVSKHYFSRHKVLDVKTNEQVIKDVEFNFIELPKFTKTIDQLETNIDQWTYFIKNAENLTVIPENVIDPGLKEAYEQASKQNWTKAELEEYERASIKEGDERGRMELALSKAKIETSLEIATAFKQNGVSVEIIMKSTGLSREVIEKL